MRTLLFYKTGKDLAMQKRTEAPESEKKGPAADENRDVHTLITHLVSMKGYEMDSVIEIKFPGNGEHRYSREAVNDIVKTLDNTFMDIAFTGSEKFKKDTEYKKLSILMDIKINYHECEKKYGKEKVFL